MGTALLDEIKLAYADRHPGPVTEPQLHYMAHDSVGADMLVRVLQAIGRYNNFNPVRVAKAILLADPLAKVVVAREYSVALYITTAKSAEMIESMRSVAADEGRVEGDAIRAWWD